MRRSLIKTIIIITTSFTVVACVSKPRIQFEPAEVGANCEAGFESRIATQLMKLDNRNTEQYYHDIYSIMLSVAGNYNISSEERDDIAKVLFDNYVHCIDNKNQYNIN